MPKAAGGTTALGVMDSHRLAVAMLAAASLYALLYFVACKLPVIGTPTFRIDYFVASVRRGDEGSDFLAAIWHSRPVSGLYAALQAAIANLLQNETRFIIYPLQHAALIAYFFCIVKVLESVFRIRLGIISLLAAWVLFAFTPVTIDGVYKQETIVGTLSMLFGSLSMLALVRWREHKGRLAASAFLGFYALSVFAKEDFAIPPALLLAWYLFENGVGLARLKEGLFEQRWLIAGMAAITVWFLVFNLVLIPDRAFITPVNKAGAPYAMSLDPSSVYATASRYAIGLERNTTLLFLAHAGVTVAALIVGRKRMEALLVLAIVAGLMAPYVIMPNHVYGYYGIKWFAFQAIGLVLLVRAVAGGRVYVSHIACIALVAWIFGPSLDQVIRNDGRFWHVTTYLRSNMAVSSNLHGSLKDLRPELNRSTEVSVVGVGPGGIVNTPWQGNGETAFYLATDLGLEPRWTLYVESDGPRYRIGGEADPTASVSIKPIDELPEDPDAQILFVGKDGKAILVSRDAIDRLGKDAIERPVQAAKRVDPAKWVAGPGIHVGAEPMVIGTCVRGARPKAMISWDVSSSGATGRVEIWVHDGQDRKLWLSGANKGSAVTGPWVHGGTTFDFELATNHAKVASITLGGIRCN